MSDRTSTVGRPDIKHYDPVTATIEYVFSVLIFIPFYRNNHKQVYRRNKLRYIYKLLNTNEFNAIIY